MSFEPEALLGREDGAAFRRFVEWSVGAGFDLAVVEITTPWKRDALMAWTQEKIPGAKGIPLHEVGPGKRRLWDLLREACEGEGGATALIFHHLEEAEAKRRIIAQLNVERDELVKAFALPWILIVHPVAGRELQDKAPDFSDFAGLWLWEEAPEGFKELRAGIAALSVSSAPTTVGEMGVEEELLSRASRAFEFGHPDEAADLLAQFDLRYPRAREADPDRIWLEGRMLAARSRFADAKLAYEAARRGYESHGARDGSASCLHALAIIAEGQGQYAEAETLVQEALLLFEQAGNQMGRAASLHQLASIALRQGRYNDARALLRESIVVKEQIGDRAGRAASLHQLAILEWRQGAHEEARKLLCESIAIKDELDNRAGRAASLHQLALIEDEQGRHEEARALLRESIAIAETIGARGGRAASLHHLAMMEWRRGEYEDARKLLREAIEIFEAIGGREGLAASLVVLGTIEAESGKLSEGRRLAQRGVDLFAEIGSGQLQEARAHLQAIDALSTPPEASSG